MVSNIKNIISKQKRKKETLTRIYLDYTNHTYMTENESVGNNSGLDFDTVLTIQRQELLELCENGELDWETAFKIEGDFVAWNMLIDDFQGYAE